VVSSEVYNQKRPDIIMAVTSEDNWDVLPCNKILAGCNPISPYAGKVFKTHFLSITFWMWYVLFFVMISRLLSEESALERIEPELNPKRCSDSE
jgi:hypothetical protein